MQETRSGIDARRKLARWSAVFAVTALVVVGCTNSAASSAPAASTAPTAAPASEAPASEAPASAGARLAGRHVPQDRLHLARRLGPVREARLRRHQGRRPTAAGQELLFCDSEIDAAKALACAQNLKVQGAEGVLNFQVFQDSSPEICAAYGNVPTIAIDIVQPPCQIAFMGANNHEAGRLGGRGHRQVRQDNWDCDYTAYVSLESTAAGAANTDRMGGCRDGFKEFCPIPADKEQILDGADRTDPALEQMTNLLRRAARRPDRRHGHQRGRHPRRHRRGATRSAARRTCSTRGQGTDPSIWKDIACNPKYIASVAYFPERYGTHCSSRP